jgi:N6-L-threonylcarbamoyladenine synthase
MKILGIETSCDDTSCAVLDGREVLSNVTASQDAVHAPFGGVVPELAARRHLETIDSVLHRALDAAGLAITDIDAIAVTRGPGLVGSLLVGVSAARGLALRTGLPLFGVHHLEGHALSPLMHEEIPYPFLSMVVSGGHSSLYLVRDIGNYEEVASTRDDSAGEAFDKGAKMLGLGFPGGKVIDDLAKKGNARAIAFPRGRVKADPLALSFSGMKTALWDYLTSKNGDVVVEDVCASFQEAIVDVLVARATAAMQRFGQQPPSRPDEGSRARGRVPPDEVLHGQRRHDRPCGSASPRARPSVRRSRSSLAASARTPLRTDDARRRARSRQFSRRSHAGSRLTCRRAFAGVSASSSIVRRRFASSNGPRSKAAASSRSARGAGR